MKNLIKEVLVSAAVILMAAAVYFWVAPLLMGYH